VTTWQLIRTLLIHVLRGRGRHRVGVILYGEHPNEIRDWLDSHDWPLIYVTAQRANGRQGAGRFLLLCAMRGSCSGLRSHPPLPRQRVAHR
jgi:hypothetical protein